MKANYKAREQRQKMIDLTANNFKIFLYALHRSEGFGENRLLRVIEECLEVANMTHYNNDDMLIIDRVLEQVLGKDEVTAIGREPLDIKGEF